MNTCENLEYIDCCKLVGSQRDQSQELIDKGLQEFL